MRCNKLAGCHCADCLPFEMDCEECGKTITSLREWSRHKLWHNPRPKPGKRRQPLETGRKRVVLVPDGLGNLTKIVTTPKMLQTKNLAAVSRFSTALNGLQRKWGKRSLSTVKALEAEPSNYLHTVTFKVPKAQALAAYKIAQAANVNPADVFALINAYGLEYLHQELKATGAAPPPKDPKVSIVTNNKKLSPREEYLGSKGLPVRQNKETVYEVSTAPSVSFLQYERESARAAAPPVPAVPAPAPSTAGRGVSVDREHPIEPDPHPSVPPAEPHRLRYFPIAEL